MFSIVLHRGGLTSTWCNTALASLIPLNLMVSLHLVSLRDFVFGIYTFLTLFNPANPSSTYKHATIIKAAHY